MSLNRKINNFLHKIISFSLRHISEILKIFMKVTRVPIIKFINLIFYDSVFPWSIVIVRMRTRVINSFRNVVTNISIRLNFIPYILLKNAIEITILAFIVMKQRLVDTIFGESSFKHSFYIVFEEFKIFFHPFQFFFRKIWIEILIRCEKSNVIIKRARAIWIVVVIFHVKKNVKLFGEKVKKISHHNFTLKAQKSR